MAEAENKKRRVDSILGEKLEDHPSYALVGISRVQGRFRLFGSPIEPQHAIVLTIHKASSHHGLGSDRHFDKHSLFEIAMSETQFAQMITSPNTGCGVPCTIGGYRENDKWVLVEDPPKQTSEASRTRAAFKREVGEKLGAMDEVRSKLFDVIDGSALSIKKKDEIKESITRMVRLFTDSAPFMMKCFEENVEKVIGAAKTEISSHAALVLQQTGVQALAEGAVPMLASGEPKTAD